MPISLYFNWQGFNITHAGSRLIAMVKPAYKAICRLSPRKPVIVFVPSRKQSKITALDLLSFCGAENQPQRYPELFTFFFWFFSIGLKSLEVYEVH